MIYCGEIISGEWDMIPIRQEFKYRGYTCVIAKANLGHLCGYVKIPKSLINKANYYELESNIRVHGGITFTGFGHIGFDCNHTHDFTPAVHNHSFVASLARCGVKPKYRDSEYVTSQLKNVVDQMISMYKKEK